MSKNFDRLVNHHIFVVDDDELSANLLVMILNRYGCKAKSFYNATTAIESLKLKMPSIIFLDIDMDELNGIAAAKKIRQIQAKSKPTLIALSGSGRPSDINLARDAGFDHYLLKPLDLILLDEIIGNLNLLTT